LTPLIEEHTFSAILPKLAAAVGKDTGGACVLGIHAEGPFTNPERRGFIPLNAISAPDMKLLDDILEFGGGKIVEMTIAPELHGSLEVISRCAREGIVMSLGHSNATLTDVLTAIDCGASHVTHFFNAMSPINHHEPGLAGAALYSTDLSVEIISDGFHIHPWIMGLILQNKGVALTCLITDAMSVMGFDNGDYETLGQKVTLRDGRLSRTDDPSTLAGSVLSMDRAVGNMIAMLGISIVDAVTMASTTPASVISLENSKGRIEPGFDADIAVLDRTYRTKMTIVQGKIVYSQ
jgi:N-acetylglucosamine-6-phosphate deacetylase